MIEAEIRQGDVARVDGVRDLLDLRRAERFLASRFDLRGIFGVRAGLGSFSGGTNRGYHCLFVVNNVEVILDAEGVKGILDLDGLLGGVRGQELPEFAGDVGLGMLFRPVIGVKAGDPPGGLGGALGFLEFSRIVLGKFALVPLEIDFEVWALWFPVLPAASCAGVALFAAMVAFLSPFCRYNRPGWTLWTRRAKGIHGLSGLLTLKPNPGMARSFFQDLIGFS